MYLWRVRARAWQDFWGEQAILSPAERWRFWLRAVALSPILLPLLLVEGLLLALASIAIAVCFVGMPLERRVVTWWRLRNTPALAERNRGGVA
jgi:hypothetical protein